MFGLFNIILDKQAYDEDETRLVGLGNTLRSIGIKPVDLREAPIVENSTGKEVSRALIVQCKEMRPFAKKKYMKAVGMREIEYEGLPSLI